MAGLLVAGAIAAQPKVSAFVDKLKSKRQERKQLQRDVEGEGVAGSSSSPSHASASVSSADVVQVLALFLAARKLRDEAKQRTTAAGSELTTGPAQGDVHRPEIGRGESEASFSSPVEDGTGALPAYGRSQQTLKAQSNEDGLDLPPAYSTQHPLSELNDLDLLWSAMIAQSMSRLEAYCLHVLPSPGSAGSSSSPSQRDPPSDVMPPADVYTAWASIMAGSAAAQPARQGSLLSKLNSYSLPLQCLGKSATFNEKAQTSWERATKLPYRLSDVGTSSDSLFRGLRVCCPSPRCDFAAFVPFAAAGTSLDSPGPSSQRGLVQRHWRRRCQDCGQEASMDTLVGRRLLEDIQAWCEAKAGYGAAHFAGLLYGEESGELDAAGADVVASQLLTPLFKPALSKERQRRNEALLADGTLGSERPGTSNSLGAAMRQAASTTLATQPYTLGSQLNWSFESICTWLRDHTLFVNPMPALAGSKEAGMPNEHASVPDRMGGGFSAGGLNFTVDSPYEEDESKPAAVQAREKRERLLAFVDRLLAPYQLLKEEGQPSAEGTLSPARNENAPTAWTDVVLGVRRPFKRLLTMGKEVESWHGRQDDFPRTAAAAYERTLAQLRSSRSRARQPPFRREALSIKEVEEALTSRGTPIEVRCAHLAHELGSADGYAADMMKAVGCVPRGAALR